MMYGSQDHALNLTKTCLNLDMFWNFCKILQSPSDGHCLLHSTISSVKSQLKPYNVLHTGYLLHLIKNEIWTNPKHYSCFIKNNDELCLYNGFHEYAFYKRYDSKLGDLIPTIICEVLNVDLIIMEGGTDVIYVKSVVERHNTVPIFCTKLASTTMALSRNQNSPVDITAVHMNMMLMVVVMMMMMMFLKMPISMIVMMKNFL